MPRCSRGCQRSLAVAPAYFFSKHQAHFWQEQPALLVPGYNSWPLVLNKRVGSGCAGPGCCRSSSASLLCQPQMLAARFQLYFQDSDGNVGQQHLAGPPAGGSFKQEHSREQLGLVAAMKCGGEMTPVRPVHNGDRNRLERRAGRGLLPSAQPWQVNHHPIPAGSSSPLPHHGAWDSPRAARGQWWRFLATDPSGFAG